MAITLEFGKHEGKSLEWLFFHDLGYVWYLVNARANFKDDPEAGYRFYELVRRASHLRIPGLCPYCENRPITQMYLVHKPGGGLAQVFFECDTCEPMGPISTTPHVPSFCAPDWYKKYDKAGASVMVAAIKVAYFGSASVRMSQKRMETFFDNPENFVSF